MWSQPRVKVSNIHTLYSQWVPPQWWRGGEGSRGEASLPSLHAPALSSQLRDRENEGPELDQIMGMVVTPGKPSQDPRRAISRPDTSPQQVNYIHNNIDKQTILKHVMGKYKGFTWTTNQLMSSEKDKYMMNWYRKYFVRTYNPFHKTEMGVTLMITIERVIIKKLYFLGDMSDPPPNPFMGGKNKFFPLFINISVEPVLRQSRQYRKML